MKTDIHLKIKQNEYYLRYLRENSYWYKYLNRSPLAFREFEAEVKEKYQITRADKISRTIDTINMGMKVLSSLR